jgi:hypothetical protein
VMDFLCAGGTWETASNRDTGDSDPQVVVLGPLSRPDTGHTGRSGIGKAAIGETANSFFYQSYLPIVFTNTIDPLMSHDQ